MKLFKVMHYYAFVVIAVCRNCCFKFIRSYLWWNTPVINEHLSLCHARTHTHMRARAQWMWVNNIFVKYIYNRHASLLQELHYAASHCYVCNVLWCSGCCTCFFIYFIYLQWMYVGGGRGGVVLWFIPVYIIVWGFFFLFFFSTIKKEEEEENQQRNK